MTDEGEDEDIDVDIVEKDDDPYVPYLSDSAPPPSPPPPPYVCGKCGMYMCVFMHV